MATLIEREDALRAKLLEDLSESRRVAREGAIARGAPKKPTQIAVRAGRLQRGAALRSQLNATKSLFNKAAKQIGQEASGLGRLEQARFQVGMQERLNAVRFEMMKRASEFQKQLAKRKLDAATKRTMIEAFGKAMGVISENLVSNIGVSQQQAPPLRAERTRVLT